MSAREQVADLRPGDVVEVFRNQWPNGTTVRGPLYEACQWLYVAEQAIRNDQGQPVLSASYTLTVVSRAPRPLYVNHDREKPVPGDVAADADGIDPTLWYFLPADPCCLEDPWVVPLARWEIGRVQRHALPARLRLLVDGETGMTVPQ